MGRHTIASRMLRRSLPGIASLALALCMLAAPAAAAPAATSPARLPMVASSASKADISAAASAIQTINTLLGIGPDGMMPASVTPADVALPFDGRYYWTGDRLSVDGWVVNDTSSDVGPVFLRLLVETTGGVELVDALDAVAIYNLHPGERATFKAIYTLPAHAGNAMNVSLATLAVQPAAVPDAVDLTFVSQSFVTDTDGVRTWTFTYRNDSEVAVENAMLGGWEYDSGGLIIDTLASVTIGRVEPGATVAVQALGARVGATVDHVETYCQAAPAPPKQLDPVFRFYNPSKGTHFYTVSAEERDMVLSRWSHVFAYEGIAYYTNQAANFDALYRFYYNRGGTHFYTASYEEAVMIVAKWPSIFTYEGPAYRVSQAQVPNSLTVYRFLNRRNSSHFFTASAEEADFVRSRWSSTYIYEGPAFWVAQ